MTTDIVVTRAKDMAGQGGAGQGRAGKGREGKGRAGQVVKKRGGATIT